MKDYLKEIEAIELEIEAYYSMSFTSEKESYNKNKLIKNKLKKVIIELNNNHEKEIEQALFVLARNTGCVENQEIAEEIIEHLHENNFIDTTHINYFYENINTGRWY